MPAERPALAGADATPGEGGVRQTRIGSWLAAAALPAATLVVLLIAIEAAQRGGLLPPTLPAPTQVWGSLIADAGLLWYHLQPTLVSIAVGYLGALAVALALGAAANVVRRAEHGIFNVGIVVDSIPIIAITPILIIWLGMGTPARIIIAGIPAFFPMLVGAIQGFKAIDRLAGELFHVLSASPLQRLRWLALPSALPYLFAAFKVAAPLAVLGGLIAEWAGADRGLGVMMTYAMFAYKVPQVWLTIIATALLAVAFYGAIAALERVVVTWDTGGRIGEGR